MRRENYKRLGEYIFPYLEKNVGLKVTLSQGINNNKYFQTPRQVAVDSENDQIVRTGQFAYNKATTRNGEKISIAYREGPDCTVSSAYQVFYIKDEEKLNPHYLLMWFKRPEFDRYARFKSFGSAHEFFTWEEMCNVYLPIPSIEEQRKIVAEYQAVEQRIENNNRLIKALEDTAQAIYHHTFVENIDPENLPEGWRMGKLSDIAEYSKERIDTSELDNNSYISTENMLKDKAGVIEADKIPEGRCIKFKVGDILLSNIRPYFKKVWKCTFDGGCSADVLCIRTKVNYPPEYTYQVVENDKFFDYVTAGCKGTKMPRGDKDWNMNYIIPIPSIKSMNYFRINAMRIGNYIELLRNENMLQFKLKNLLLSKLS